MINTARKGLHQGPIQLRANQLRSTDCIFTPTFLYRIKGVFNNVGEALAFSDEDWQDICETFDVASTDDLVGLTFQGLNRLELMRKDAVVNVLRTASRHDYSHAEHLSARSAELVPGDIIKYEGCGLEVAEVPRLIGNNRVLVKMTNDGHFIFDKDFKWSILRPVSQKE